MSYFKNPINLGQAHHLQIHSLKFQNVKPTGSFLQGMSFVITGSFGEVDRNSLKDAIVALGGVVTGSVSKKTNYLLAGNEPGANKIADAHKHGITIVTFKDNVSLDHLIEQIKELNVKPF